MNINWKKIGWNISPKWLQKPKKDIPVVDTKINRTGQLYVLHVVELMPILLGCYVAISSLTQNDG